MPQSDPTPSTPTGLQVLDLSRRFGRRWVLARVHLTLPAGSSCMLTGANGSGKTTMLRCIATALKPHHGAILFNGSDLWLQRRAMRPSIALLSHATRLYEDLDAKGNLRTWARLGGYKINAEELIERVGLPTDRRDAVRNYSAGMRRRLALARVLIKQPDLLLLDEPFTALDPEGRQLVMDTVRTIQERGVTLLIATHLPQVATAVCEHHVHMEYGRVETSTLESNTPPEPEPAT
ncbi:MAG: heme exporter protein A [Kiritimatiellia bacterium]|jgi:heme exporter protein A